MDEFARQIISGALLVGSLLPTEGVLCEQFGFSRTVMREGMKLLEERGLIRVEQGRGTTVQPRESWHLLDPVVLRIALEYDGEMHLLDDLIGVRRLLEMEMARAAAARVTEEDLAVLAENVDRMSSSTDDYELFRDFDLAFHACLMRVSGREISRTIVSTIHMYAGKAPHLSVPGSRESLERTVDEHQGILQALAARDGDLAAARIAGHIDSAWDERRRGNFV